MCGIVELNDFIFSNLSEATDLKKEWLFDAFEV